MLRCRTVRVGVLTALLVRVVPPASAQSTNIIDRKPAASGLSVNLVRIKDGLRSLVDAPAQGRLRLDVHVEVYGRRGPSEVLGQIDFGRGAVPSGAPTHAQLMDVMTPRNFRVRGADAAACRRAINWLRGRR